MGEGCALEDTGAGKRPIAHWLVVLALFLIGMWLIVINPLGPNLSRMPGDLGDTRLNYYILEHDYRWISGLDPSLWDAPFFYPYRQTLALSDNHLGSMPFYIPFRWLDLDRETAFQAWYIIGYCLNFFSAAYVLKRYQLTPLAIGAGAFLFTFGLPVLAQELHQQLIYRFCIPLACYSFWQFSQKPSLKTVVFTLFWLVWQFFLSIYLGIFLSFLLVAVILVSPFCAKLPLCQIPSLVLALFKQAWKNSCKITKFVGLFTTLCLGMALVFLLRPYVHAAKTYEISRSWSEVSPHLPRLKSYFLADRSKIWQTLTKLSPDESIQRSEQQLFIGIAACFLLLMGLIWRFHSPQRKMVSLFLWATALLFLLTIFVGRFSLYIFLWILPGINGIRAVSRIILILIWPISLMIGVEIDALIKSKKRLMVLMAILLMDIMVAESVFYNHYTYPKEDSRARIQRLRDQIPAEVPPGPLLFVAYDPTAYWIFNELDAMVLSQDLGWPALNGYSGAFPPGYGSTIRLDCAVTRIKEYSEFMRLSKDAYLDLILRHVVTLSSME